MIVYIDECFIANISTKYIIKPEIKSFLASTPKNYLDQTVKKKIYT